MNRSISRTAVLLALLMGCASTPPNSSTTTAAPTTTSGAEATTTTTPAVEADAAVSATPAVEADAAVAAVTDAATPTATTTTATTTSTTTSTPTAATSTPTAATSHPTTPAAAAGGAANGHAVLTRACGRCHEDNDPDGPSPNKNWDEARMRRQIRQGSARMRAIPASRLSDADLDLLIAYLRTTHAVR